MTNINITFSRSLLAEGHKAVKVFAASVNLRSDAWVYKLGRDKWEFHGPADYYWHGSASNAYEARYKGWMAWLASKGASDIQAAPAKSVRRTRGKCPACRHFGSNCKCHEKDVSQVHEYLFDATLLASFRVKAGSEAEARAKLKEHLDCADANFGAWKDTGAPITAEASIDTEGELDLAEVDGEAV